MPLSVLLRRAIAFILILTLPVGLIGFALGALRGLVVVEALLFICLITTWFRAEAVLKKVYQVSEKTSAGAQHSLERVIALLGGTPPDLKTCLEFTPFVVLARSPGSNGTVILSEGLLGILNEDELRSLLRVSVLRLRTKDIVFQTLTARLAHAVFQLAPRPWLEFFYGKLKWNEHLSPLSAIGFLPLLAIARFFMQLGRLPNGVASIQPDAPRVYSKYADVGCEIVNPGFSALHLVDPWASRNPC